MNPIQFLKMFCFFNLTCFVFYIAFVIGDFFPVFLSQYPGPLPLTSPNPQLSPLDVEGR